MSWASIGACRMRTPKTERIGCLTRIVTSTTGYAGVRCDRPGCPPDGTLDAHASAGIALWPQAGLKKSRALSFLVSWRRVGRTLPGEPIDQVVDDFRCRGRHRGLARVVEPVHFVNRPVVPPGWRSGVAQRRPRAPGGTS